jgi:hypothetical protein
MCRPRVNWRWSTVNLVNLTFADFSWRLFGRRRQRMEVAQGRTRRLSTGEGRPRSPWGT